MEQDVNEKFINYCNGCLNSVRNLYCIRNMLEYKEILRFLYSEVKTENSISLNNIFLCWECLAIIRKICKFKKVVCQAQVYLETINRTNEEVANDTYVLPQTLSSLEIVNKSNYDAIYYDYTLKEQSLVWGGQQFLAFESPQNIQEGFDVSQSHATLPLDYDNMLPLSEIVLENTEGDSNLIPQIVVGADPLVSSAGSFPIKGEPHELTLDATLESTKSVVLKKKEIEEVSKEVKCGYITCYMTEEEMIKHREDAKSQLQYTSASYKCELCISWFYTQQQLEQHFLLLHRPRDGEAACRVCYAYMPEDKLRAHTDRHYLRYECKLCAHACTAAGAMLEHVRAHQAVKRKSKKEAVSNPPKAGDLRKLLSKTTIEVYRCLECDMFFKTSRARKGHVARFHREGFVCDHCNKRFVNRTTLATHLKLHQGPQPRAECPVCGKQVRVATLKYHVQRHNETNTYTCADCDKVFSHMATYRAHLRYSRAHASDDVYKFPCPVCNKAYPTKQAMQDHFNYQHLGKTMHKCPVCDKPIATRLNVERHMMRVHRDKKPKPRNHVCPQCHRAFTDNKALTQHVVIHSGERPLSCDICHQTFKQKASLYTHKRRVHKVVPNKKVVQFEAKADAGV